MKHSCTLLFLFAFVCLLIPSCETHSYETGDGKHSGLQATFADVYTRQSETVVNALFDDGRTVNIQPALKCSWAEAPETAYRALLYYYDTDDNNIVKPYSAQQVIILQWNNLHANSSSKHTDPIHVESKWISKNRKYVNMRIGIMVGQNEDGSKSTQQIGITLDNTTDNQDGTSTYELTLRHSQNDVPEYYTSHQYISLPLEGCNAGDILKLKVNTYSGWQTHTFAI